MPKRKTKKAKKKTSLELYIHNREKFYKDHPRIRILLAIFVVSFVLFMACIFRKAY